MSKNFEYNAAEGKERANGKIKNGVFAYCKLHYADFKYESKTEKEYGVDFIVDKATAKAFKKKFPKNKVREVDTPDFEGIYKIPAPFPEQDEQFVLKLRARAQLARDNADAGLKAGDMVPYSWSNRPKAYEMEDGKVRDITMDENKIPANGSKGHLSYTVLENTYGSFIQLGNILITDLIPYAPKAKATSNEWGEIIQDETTTEFDNAPEAPQESEIQEEADDVPFEADVAEDQDGEDPFA